MKPIFEYCNQLSSINEYLSISKIKQVKKVLDPPEDGCTTEDIADWLDSYNIEKQEFHFGPGRQNPPKKGKLHYIIGPYRSGNPIEYWVSLRNHWGQNVVMKPKDESFVSACDGQKKVSFSDAVKAAKLMLETPDKKIKFNL